MQCIQNKMYECQFIVNDSYFHLISKNKDVI